MFWRLTLFHSHLLLFQSSAFLLSLLMTESLPKGSWREFNIPHLYAKQSLKVARNLSM